MKEWIIVGVLAALFVAFVVGKNVGQNTLVRELHQANKQIFEEVVRNVVRAPTQKVGWATVSSNAPDGSVEIRAALNVGFGVAKKGGTD